MELKDVLHYYIGQKCEIVYLKQGYNWVSMNPTVIDFHICTLCKEAVWTIIPILRKIDSLTDEEKNKLKEFMTDPNVSNSERNIFVITQYHTPKSFHYLLSIGIDLFSLCDNGLAIDKNEL